jgi:arsenate reductase
MAEGFLKHYGSDKFETESAGSKPSHVNPTAIEVMKEVGVDISGHHSKHLREFEKMHFDYVITVCDNANESCPVFPTKTKRLHWPFPDPPHAKEVTPAVVEEFRHVRDLIHVKFKAFALDGV